ncbi:MAG: 30S ribosome-binding factor RbfA [Rikenellaceae bacterium]|jgi:ribosome-binding factor A|nr:30S ribosome-binding factor RbfA [Rikenellaceae bacterium]
MENTRQQKVARQIQKDLSEILSREAASLLRGAMVTVTSVRMSPDLEYAKAYLSIFPFEKHEAVMASLEANLWFIRKTLGGKVRNQLRVVPEVAFLLDDSLEYIDKIDELLKEDERNG